MAQYRPAGTIWAWTGRPGFTTIKRKTKPTPFTMTSSKIWQITALATSCACLASFAAAQESTPPPPVPASPRPSPAPSEPRRAPERPVLTERDVQEYKDLARQLGEEIDRLVRKGLCDAADELQRRVEQAAGGSPQGLASQRKADHLLEAAEHLAQAGREQEAAALRSQAEQLKREEGNCLRCSDLESLRRRVDQLESTVQGLKEENRELRRLLERKPL